MTALDLTIIGSVASTVVAGSAFLAERVSKFRESRAAVRNFTGGDLPAVMAESDRVLSTDLLSRLDNVTDKMNETLLGLNSAVVRLGPILVVKDGDSITTRILTPAENQLLDTSPEAIRDPRQLLAKLDAVKGDSAKKSGADEE